MPVKLSRLELERILADIRNEPPWRKEAAKAADYYDSLQITAKDKQDMEERGLAPLFRNLIAPSIDLVLGMEAKSRRDLKLSADRDEDAEAVEAVQIKLKGAERSSRFDVACSDAYAETVKTGLSWIECGWESDPFRPRYRARKVARTEIWWDWRSRENDLSDARYLVRRRWVDADVLPLYFPNKAKLIEGLEGHHPDFTGFDADIPAQSEMINVIEAASSSTLARAEWYDAERRQYALYEVWYRHWVRGTVLRLADDQVIEYDKGNLAQAIAIAMGQAVPEPATFTRMRLSWWCGPVQLDDLASPLPHNNFPYTPVWGIREDRSGMPYGLIRRMMSPQDEINARLSKMMWLLSAKRVIADSDAADMPWHDVVEEAGRPDALILLNPRRVNKSADALRVESDTPLTAQQFSVLQDATQAIRDASGIQEPMMGGSTGALRSGAAVTSLIEQGSTTLAEINDNYATAKKLAGEQLLALVVADLGTQPHTVAVNFRGQQRQVVLNQLKLDPDIGGEVLTNAPAHLLMRVDLTDVPDTPSYRAQVFQQLTELTKSLPPELQALIADMVVRNADIPNAAELADRIARFVGVEQSAPRTPEEAQQRAAEQQAAQQAQALEQAAAEAEVMATRAKAEKDFASAQQSRAAMMNTQHKSILDEQRLALDQDQQALDAVDQALAREQASDKLQLDARKIEVDAKNKAAQMRAAKKSPASSKR